MKRFHGKITKENLDQTAPLFVGDIYEDNIWQFENAIQNPIQYIRDRTPEECVFLNGSFLFLKKNGDAIYIGTDQNSVYPLFYTVYGQTLYYSWNIDKLLGLIPYKPEMNWDNLLSWLVVGPVGFNNETRLNGINRLEAGSYIKYDGKIVSVWKSKPFIYQPDYSLSFDECLYRLTESLTKAMSRRLRGNPDKAILCSLSGGIDSRIVLSELVKHTKNVICYTYGENEFIEKIIARQVVDILGLEWLDIEIDKWSYLEAAYDEAEISGGMSLFKHMPQFYFSEKLKKLSPHGVLFGSALDLLIGNSYPVFDGFGSGANSVILKLFVNKAKVREIELYSQDARNKVYVRTNSGGAFDRACSYHIETRVKHWYNWNLIYHLRNHKLLLPTYDKDFLAVVSSIPEKYRSDDAIRIELLKRLNYKASKIAYNSTMKPAYIKNPNAYNFREVVKVRDKHLHRLWIDQNIYIPSNTFDFNFIEWSRVFKQYRDFVEDILFSIDSILVWNHLSYNKLWDLWQDHLKGKANYHKELMMLISAELCCRHFMGE